MQAFKTIAKFVQDMILNQLDGMTSSAQKPEKNAPH